MLVTSLGYRTDLALRALEGSEIAEYDDCLVVRSPANPAFRWGNFILLREPPAPGEAQNWVTRFGREFPGAEYVALGIDVTAADQASVGEFLAAGFRRELGSVLGAAAVRLPPHPNHDADYRPLATEQDWRQAAALGSACHLAGPVEQDFLHRRMAARRQLAEDGHGAWFGAFLHQRLAAHLGIFRAADGIARFQDVETHPDARRQGLAGTLIYHAAKHAITSLTSRALVIVADPADNPITLYRSLGFEDLEQQVSLEQLAADRPPAGGEAG